MTQLFSNAARGYLASAIGPEDTTITLREGGELFPTLSEGEWFKAVIEAKDLLEVIYVKAHAEGSNTFSEVLRGQEGTVASSFNENAVVGLRITAGDASNWSDKVGLGKTHLDAKDVYPDWDSVRSQPKAGWFKIEDGGEGIPEGNAPNANYGIIMPRHAEGYFSAMFMPYGEQGNIVVRNQHGSTSYDHTIWTDRNFNPGPWALGDSNPIIETSISISALPYQTIGIDTSAEGEVVTITLPANPEQNQWVSFFDSKSTWGDNNPIILRNGNLIMGLDEDISIDIMGGNFTLTYLNAERGWVITK